MAKVTKLPFSSRTIRSMVSQPLRWVTLDMEYIKDENTKEYEIIEICIWDVISDQEIFHSLVKPKNPNALSVWRQERGYDIEALKLAPKFEEIDRLLQYLLPSCMVIVWNKEFDLTMYPMLPVRCYALRDAMVRYSQNYGPYNLHFGDRSYVKLSQAAQKTGFELEEDQFFHTARTDCRATAFVWRYCDAKELPNLEIPQDLVLRAEVDSIIEKFQESLQTEEDSLESNEVEVNTDEKSDEEETPF